LGDLELYWLDGGRFELDGGAMFGVVPKKLWEKRIPSDDENFIQLVSRPILVKTAGERILIETGIGNKLTDKQRKIFRIREEWDIISSLDALGLHKDDIGHVILTHLDFDHAGGITMREGDRTSLTFPNAKHIIQKRDWEDGLAPSKRASHSYWSINYDLLKDSGNLELVDGDTEIIEGVRTILSGGHHRGHQLVIMESNGEKAIHMGDVLPTHAHFNPLWIMAYDDFPLDVIRLKEEWERTGIEEGAWFTFYHDPHVLACKFDEKGEMMDRHPDV
jgi:glyoxylase-like metal-dependent hydrolase (beta-lactamase superfamily II)